MTNTKARLLLLSFAALVGCGDPLVDGAYRGEALYTINGWVQLQMSPELIDATGLESEDNIGELRLAVFWAPPKGESFNLDLATEQAVQTTGVFPAKFEVTLYEPPPSSLLRTVTDGTGELALAVLLAYLDTDGDGRWDRGAERIIGGARDRLVVYTPTGIDSPTWGQVAPGFARLRASNTDCSAGAIYFKSDLESRVDLVVGMDFPAEVLLDADCDGDPNEWGGLCPPLDQVRFTCRESGRTDPFMCPACEGLLWPAGADFPTCDAWFQNCLFGAPAHECEGEYRLCIGKPPDPNLDPHCDLECVCRRYLDECYASGTDQMACKERYNQCVAPIR